jgi:hypothetical protein
MTADFEKNFHYFVTEIAPGIPELEGCEFSFDYEKKKIKIHCKDREHRKQVNEDVTAYLLFLPGERYQLTIPEPDNLFSMSISVMIEYYNGYIGRNPNYQRQYFYF